MTPRAGRLKVVGSLDGGGHQTIVICSFALLYGEFEFSSGGVFIEAFVKRNENSSSLVIVPTQILKDQWVDQLEERGLESNARVEIINSAIKLN